MNEQTINFIFLIVSLGVTLSLYIFKAKKQMNYMGMNGGNDTTKSYRIASISNLAFNNSTFNFAHFRRQPIYNHHTTTNHFVYFTLEPVIFLNFLQ